MFYEQSRRVICMVFGVAICCVFMLPGCGDDDDAAEIKSSSKAFESSVDDMVEQLCYCYADLYYGGAMAACIRDETPDTNILPTKCHEDVAACYVDDYTTLLRCYENAVNDHTSCISSCPSNLDACTMTRNTRVSACVRNAPTKFKVHLEACEAGEKFSCGN